MGLFSRYSNRFTIENNDQKYKELFDNRGVPFIEHYSVARFKKVSLEDLGKLTQISHVWGVGDKYWALAEKYYKTPKLWWVIAFFNQIPTEAMIKPGMTIYIPTPLEKVLEFIEV